METNIVLIASNIVSYFLLFTEKYKRTKDQSTVSLIELLQKKDSAQTQVISDYQTRFDTINKELGFLRGQISEKDKKIEEYMSIFQGRNPEQTKFMEYMIHATGESVKYMKESVEIFSEIKMFIHDLNGRIHEINNKVDSIKNKKI